MSFPARNAARSISPGALWFEAPFMFKASVMMSPLKSSSFFRRSVTIVLEMEEGKF